MILAKPKYIIILTVCSLLLSSIVFAQDSGEPIDSDSKNKTYFFKDHVVSLKKYYGSDKILDSLKTYHPSGNLNEEFYYNSEGRYHGDCRQFDDQGDKLVTWTFKEGKLVNRIDHKLNFNEKNEEKIKNAIAALKKLNKETNHQPTSASDIYKRATIRFLLDNNTLAIRDFKNLQRNFKHRKNKGKISKKSWADLYLKMGSLYARMEMQDHALHYKTKAVKLQPEEGRLLYNLGAYLYTIKAYRLAEHYLNETKKIWPNHAFSNWVLAGIYSDREDYDTALDFANMAIKREVNINKYGQGQAQHSPRTMRGLILHKLGQSEKGIADLNEELRINKNNSFALRNLGEVYFDLGQYKKACNFLYQAKQLNYEKIHDRYDLEYFREKSCELKVKSNYSKIKDQPFVYPNPTKDFLNIKNLNEGNYQFELYDYQAKLIQKGQFRNPRMDVSELNSGVYILNVISGDTQLTFKIIKD